MIPERMKAVVTKGHGGLEMLEYTDVPVPAPGPGEVLVKVGACGLNNTDIWVREGKYGTDADPAAVTGWNREPMAFPIIQGADIVGRIVAVGDGCPKRRIGERVIVDLALYADDPGPDELPFWGYIGADRPGGYAEYAAVPAANAHAIDSPMSDAELATFPCSYVTAEHMLARAGLKAGETVLVTGASGGVGSALVQLARVREARVIALTSGPKVDQVRTLRPMAVITRDVDGLERAIAEAVGACHVQVVADVVGGPRFQELLAVLLPNGRYVTAGAIGGPVVEMDLRSVYIKHLTLYGHNMGTRQDFARLLGYIRDGKIRPLLAQSYRLSEIRKAQERFMSKTFFGNLAVTPP
jgi:NADPH:quinone reductase-like Zn-dependent oxidoreductase